MSWAASPGRPDSTSIRETIAGWREVHHDPRAPGREQAVAEGGDQALLPRPAGLVRQVKGDLGQVDDDPVGPLHERGMGRDGLRQEDLKRVSVRSTGDVDGGRDGLGRVRPRRSRRSRRQKERGSREAAGGEGQAAKRRSG